MRRAFVSRYVLQYFLFKDDYSNIQVVLSHIIFFLMQNTRTAYFDRLSSAVLVDVTERQRATCPAKSDVGLQSCVSNVGRGTCQLGLAEENRDISGSQCVATLEANENALQDSYWAFLEVQ